MDLVGAGACLLALSPLFAAVSLLIKAVSPGPVFFRQSRVGYRGGEFVLLKFRTMVVNGDPERHREYVIQLINSSSNGDDIPMRKLEGDPRIIAFGRVLRALCIDELPQLVNVLRGEMSLVGPRPSLSYEVENYEVWHRGRLGAVPGMTGLWQVSGKNRLTFGEMARLDIEYAGRVTFWGDVRILLHTPRAILEVAVDALKRSWKRR